MTRHDVAMVLASLLSLILGITAPLIGLVAGMGAAALCVAAIRRYGGSWLRWSAAVIAGTATLASLGVVVLLMQFSFELA